MDAGLRVRQKHSMTLEYEDNDFKIIVWGYNILYISCPTHMYIIDKLGSRSHCNMSPSNWIEKSSNDVPSLLYTSCVSETEIPHVVKALRELPFVVSLALLAALTSENRTPLQASPALEIRQ